MKHAYGHRPGRRFLAALSAALLLATGNAVALQEKAEADPAPSAAAQTGGAEPVDADSGDASYRSYRQAHASQARPIADYRLEGASALVDGEATQQDGQIRITGSARTTWVLEVGQRGLYHMAIRYAYTDTESVIETGMGVQIGGVFPFKEAASLELRRWWRDAGEIVPNANGNDRKPVQEQLSLSKEVDLTDASGAVRDYLFLLEEGENRITLQFDGGGLAVEYLRVYNAPVSDYETYCRELSGKPHGGQAYKQIIQAETPLYKNDSSLVASRDRSGPATMPSDPVKLKLNIINGSAYDSPGQVMAWEFEVEEDGFYKIGMRTRQNVNEGLFVTRRLTVDGKLPFEECGDMRFYYSNKWAYSELGGDAAQLVYLEAGKHLLEMEVVSGVSGDIAAWLDDAVFTLNSLYRKIIIITSVDPDEYRDYNLEEEIPELLPGFQKLADELEEILGSLKTITGQKGGLLSVLTQLIYQLRDFIEDPVTITERLENYKSNVSNVASLLMTLQLQPLDVDYLVILGENQDMGDTESDFFDTFLFNVRAFIGSFTQDYVSFNNADGSTQEQVTAWFNGGREQAEIIQQLLENDFTPESGVGVKLSLVQIPLTQAILAGRSPDVMLNASRGQPVNLAARTVLTDLSRLEGFDEMRRQFMDNALVPYTYRDGVYGLPVTMDYHMLFYRIDVLEELGVQPPQTWEELYKIIPIIQRNNMTIGLPYTVMSTQTTIDEGLGAKDIFPTLLMQKGGSFYNAARTEVALDSATGIEAFKEWIEFYTLYGFDLEYNFYNRFRTGEMPLGISKYNMYNQLKAAAPEINGLWDMTLIPGTPRADGTVDHTEAASGTAAVMLKDAKNTDAAWKLMQWWCGTQAQAAYGTELELLMGEASRYTPANLDAMSKLPWTRQQLNTLQKQMAYVTEIPEVVGSYYTSRGIDNAFRNVLFNQENYRESLMEQVETINEELARKLHEFQIQ